ncbi:hypothetical protein NOCARDAX2BIS_190024 [Nocardioides sp. AX2bis]|nr:hypothetical protein NOCARDAX2BIS_190024 [Nocardioides sp. AX2bis]
MPVQREQGSAAGVGPVLVGPGMVAPARWGLKHTDLRAAPLGHFVAEVGGGSMPSHFFPRWVI